MKSSESEEQKIIFWNVMSWWTISETNLPMSIFLKFYSFFITIGVPAYQAHGHWTQYYVRTDSYDFCSFTQPLNVRKTSPNWEKNIKDGLQNFQHTIFNHKCWTVRLDLSMNENRNLFYGLRGVFLIFCRKFGAWKLSYLYQKPWEMGLQQFYWNLEYLEKKNFFEGEKSFQGQHHSWCAELNTKGGCSKNFSKIGQKMIDL